MSIKEGFFLDKLKFSEVGPIFRKKDVLRKRIKGLLVFEDFERVMWHQINYFMVAKLLKQSKRFRKNNSTQH